MHWLALIPHDGASPETGGGDDAADARLPLGWWALQFTPRVCLLEEAVLMELAASLRLFGGEAALHARLSREAAALGVAALAGAPTGLGALALARCGGPDGFARPLPELLDALPLAALGAAAAHAPLLERLGCRTLGALRRLPRGGLARRTGALLLEALDQAYGLRPEAYPWLVLPEVFDVRLELPGRVESAPALMFGARRLLLQLAGWLAARQAGVRALRLAWRGEGRRAGAGAGELPLRTAEATRDVEHLGRLLAEHLARTRLVAPVDELRLRAEEVEPLAPASASLLPDARRDGGEPLQQLIERLAARLGAARVLWPQAREDHRPEGRVRWRAADSAGPRPVAAGARRRGTAAEPPPGPPQPAWLLEVPLPLLVIDGRPHYHGALQLLAGPHRLEAGWWDGEGGSPGAPARAERDYFVAHSPGAGLLWIYRERRRAEGEGAGWFLQGLYG
ncbi:Y-family DNA polymerase [Caldimonas tepidiphila]|uniref:Y-family DNA polymerase n=1 Tax=Caldimonas tepidiphila TaxID=2315841 RepID=UPI001F0CA3BC|nr:DNA polymerase Y family protein [Caldimonas tepidiphila]